MRPPRSLTPLAALAVAVTLSPTLLPAAVAQTLNNATSPPPPLIPPVKAAPADNNRPTIAPTGNGQRANLTQRFELANTTHDGHLTRQQAQAGLPEVARDWDKIDTQHRGWVTLDQVQGHAGGKG